VLAQGVAVITALAGLGSFFARGELPRSVLLLFAGLAVAGLWTMRAVLRVVLRSMRRRGHNLRHVMVVGTGEQAVRLIGKLEQHPDYGISIRGLVGTAATEVGATIAGHPVLGTVDDLPGLVERSGTDFVYLALPRSAWQAEEEALVRLSNSTVAVRLVPDLVRAFTLNAAVEDFDGMPVVLVTETPEQGWNAVIKRAFDLVFATLGLVSLSPLLAAIAIWVRLDSRGPILYAQERVGVNGRRFRMYKFRTMRADAEPAGAPGWTTADDPRRTRAGEPLRKLSLDELPQLWNVLLGHMSLVGPRPERPVYVDRFRASIPRYMLRHQRQGGDDRLGAGERAARRHAARAAHRVRPVLHRALVAGVRPAHHRAHVRAGVPRRERLLARRRLSASRRLARAPSRASASRPGRTAPPARPAAAAG